MRALFAVARVRQPSVIFVDEIDSLLTQRSGESICFVFFARASARKHVHGFVSDGWRPACISHGRGGCVTVATAAVGRIGDGGHAEDQDRVSGAVGRRGYRRRGQ
eukprot:COSAG01_NODE_43027_length_433_cov_92.637725_1_plen_104_part_01